MAENTKGGIKYEMTVSNTQEEEELEEEEAMG